MLLLDEPLTGLDLASAERILGEGGNRERAAGGAPSSSPPTTCSRPSGPITSCCSPASVVAAGVPPVFSDPAALAEAYGGRLLRLEGETLLLDDGAHHQTNGNQFRA